MEQFKLDEQGQNILINLFRNSGIVPILGAGITKGLAARKGYTVPDGNDLKKYMISEIIRKDNSLQSEEDIMYRDAFSHVAQVFERKFSNPSDNVVRDYFFNHFTQVKIVDESLKRFLNSIKWECVYTLNIDNAIEETAKSEWELFLPTPKFDKRLISGSKRLYKIHGDISNFLKNLDYDMLIFTEEQYLRSLEKYKGFHDSLKSDCENKSLIYIGCSLDDELDIKYSVLNNQNDMLSVGNNYRIYVTKGKLSSYRKEKLEAFRITHYIELEDDSDFSRLYDLLYDCYKKSQKGNVGTVEQYLYTKLDRIDNDRELNIKYLTCISSNQEKLPYYFVKRDDNHFNKLVNDKLNVILGRRLSGKTMMSYGILEHYTSKIRYYIPSSVTIDIELAREFIGLKNAIIIFDSNSYDDIVLQYLMDNIVPDNNSYICVVLNAFDSVYDIVTYNSQKVNSFVDNRSQKGYLSKNETARLNEKLNELQIAKFSDASNILDNTMRIANLYKQFEDISRRYMFNCLEELEVFIWLLVKRKMYYEEIVALKLNSKYREIVNKFNPFIQIEQKWLGETAKHSTEKIIANGRIGMLSLLGEYLYPSTESELSNVMAAKNQEKVCEAIYQILRNYEGENKTKVKEFIMVDVLNDIFSRIYTRKYYDSLKDKNSWNKSKLSGAASLISRVYKYKPIQDLKADDPNYWLQRAKSMYIADNASQKLELDGLYDAVQWSKKAEEDASLLIEKGDNSYWRTKSNAEVETAMLYGRIAYRELYKNRDSINSALGYYYTAFNDANNQGAVEGIIKRSKGANDFRNLMNFAIEHMECVDTDMKNSLNFLLKLHISLRF